MNTKRLFIIAIVALFALCFYSCGNPKGKTDETTVASNSAAGRPKINSTVVLEVGTERFTVFEIEKNFKVFESKFFQNTKRQPAEADIKAWINEFTQRAYVLADARKKGYYERPDVQNTVENTAMFMLSQSHGILDNKLMAQAEASVSVNKGDVEKHRRAVLTNYHNKIASLAAVSVDSAAVKWLGNILSKYKHKHEVRRKDVEAELNRTLASYSAINGGTMNISMDNFVTYYNSLPIKRYLDDNATIEMYLNQMASNEYIKRDAEKMGLLNEPEFKLNKKNFTDNVVYQKYIEEHLGANRGVTEPDLMKIYTAIKQTALHPTHIVYTMYTFENAPAAYKAFGQLQMKPNDTTINLNSLSLKRHITFSKNDSRLPDTLKKMIYRGVAGKPLTPVQTDGYFTILLIEAATGKESFEPGEIRPYLTARAREKKELEYNAQKAAELSKSLKLKNMVDIKALVSNRKQII